MELLFVLLYKRAIKGTVGLILSLGLSGAALSSNHGNLVVHVESADSQPLPDTAIELHSPSLIGGRVVTTDSRGRAVAAALPPGVYTGHATKDGFEPTSFGFTITQDRSEELRVRLEVAPLVESVDAAVPSDTTRRTPTVSAHLTLEDFASLPVSRNYRGYTQIVPGVTVVPNSDGLDVRYEPASKAGNFYHDRGAVPGSRDNVYYLDGFDFTTMGGGTGDLVFLNEAIREQAVLTSGNPAEYGGGAGFVANLLTRSGGTELSGSASAFVQSASMQEDFETSDTRLHVAQDDKWDAGLSVGGALMRERLWFFAAAQTSDARNSLDLTESASPTGGTTENSFERRNLLGKLNLRASRSDTLVFQYLHDARDDSGVRDPNTPPHRYTEVEDRGELGTLSWSRQQGRRALLEAQLHAYDRTSTAVPVDPSGGPRNTVNFEPGALVPTYQRDLGTAGDGGRSTRRKDQANASVSFFLGGAGAHEVKIGLQYFKWQEENTTDQRYGYSLSSLAPHLQGLTFGEARDLTLLPPTEFDNIFRVLSMDPGSSAFLHADANGDGVLAAEEFGALRFASLEGNQGGVNFLRSQTLVAGTNNTIQYNEVGYVQDDWRTGNWTVSAGVRLEDRRYVASDGSEILDMDFEVLPRVGAVYGFGGERRQRLSLFYGRYADPLRSSMIRFAGNLSGSVFADQVFIGDDWYTHRERGRASLPRDAGFAPNLRNEIESELQLTYALDLPARLSLMAQLYRREDEYLIEDYDPNVYLNPDVSGDLSLATEDFGYPPSGPGSVNYFLANLVGGRRRTHGLDLSLQRGFSENWSGSLQYSWKDAEGNSNSDAAADLQGDFLILDPRQPYMWGELPGTIGHQVKLLGTYRTPIDLEIGGLFYWNDGAVFTEATIFRPSSHGIYYNYQRPDGSFVQMGQRKHPSYETLDLRLRYPVRLGSWGRLDVIGDVFNVLDNQGPLRITEAHNNPDFPTFLEPRQLLAPRRFQLGVRVEW